MNGGDVRLHDKWRGITNAGTRGRGTLRRAYESYERCRIEVRCQASQVRSGPVAPGFGGSGSGTSRERETAMHDPTGPVDTVVRSGVSRAR